MSKTENVELTVLCLIEDGDKILLQNRVKKDWRGYALPGGHVEGMLSCCLRQHSGRVILSHQRKAKWNGSSTVTFL